MKKLRVRIPIALLAAMVLLVFSSLALAAHPTAWTAASKAKILNSGNYWIGSDPAPGDTDPIAIILKDKSGTDVITSGKAYSPKQTCGKCHQYENAGGIASTSINQVSVLDGVTHNVTVKSATEGVTAGYHFSQGQNEPWTAAERTFYSKPGFTTSPGMLGKF